VTAALPDAVLLDRDGTINVKAPDGEYIVSPDQLELLPGAARAIAGLNAAAVPVIVVTNQRGIALGRMTEADLAEVHVRLVDLLRDGGASVDAIFHCPHEKGVCACRKPGTLMLERARAHLGLDSLEDCVMIGDSVTDVLAASAAHAHPVRIGDRAGSERDVDVADSLLDAVERLLAEQPGVWGER